jgi:hypothetical protein
VVDRLDDLVRVADAVKGEVAVVGAGGVEVDGADAQDPRDEGLVGVDVLHALDARLLDVLGEDPALDAQALGGDRVARRDAPDEADEHVEREEHEEDDHAEPRRRDERDDDRRSRRPDEAVM